MSYGTVKLSTTCLLTGAVLNFCYFVPDLAAPDKAAQGCDELRHCEVKHYMLVCGHRANVFYTYPSRTFDFFTKGKTFVSPFSNILNSLQAEPVGWFVPFSHASTVFGDTPI